MTLRGRHHACCDLAEGVVDVGPAAFVAATRRSRGCGRRSSRPSASSVHYFSEAGGSRRAMRWRTRLEAGEALPALPERAPAVLLLRALWRAGGPQTRAPTRADLVAVHGLTDTGATRQIDEILVDLTGILARSCPRHGLHRRALRDLGRVWCGAAVGVMLGPMTSVAVDAAASLPDGVTARSSLPSVRARDRRSRRAEGRAARERAPRRDLGRWDTAHAVRDALASLLAQNAIRVQDLLPVRNGRMAASPWTYYRGAAAVMAADLGSVHTAGSPCSSVAMPTF